MLYLSADSRPIYVHDVNLNQAQFLNDDGKTIGKDDNEHHPLARLANSPHEVEPDRSLNLYDPYTQYHRHGLIGLRTNIYADVISTITSGGPKHKATRIRVDGAEIER